MNMHVQYQLEHTGKYNSIYNCAISQSNASRILASDSLDATENDARNECSVLM